MTIIGLLLLSAGVLLLDITGLDLHPPLQKLLYVDDSPRLADDKSSESFPREHIPEKHYPEEDDLYTPRSGSPDKHSVEQALKDIFGDDI